jgi:ABC-2 type transport system permease protein
MGRHLRALLVCTWYPFLALTRNRSVTFFGLAFPLAFVGIFGFVGAGAFSGVRIGVAGPADAPVVRALAASPGVTLVYESPDELEAWLRRGRVDSLVRVGSGVVRLELNPANPQSHVAALAVEKAAAEASLDLAGVSRPPLRVERVQVAGRYERYIDFALPGQVGWALLSTAVFSPVWGLIGLKQTLVLKRLRATPVPPIIILLGQGAARLLMGLIQAVIILVAGLVVFGFYLAQGWKTFGLLLLLSAFGLLAFLGVGILIGGYWNSQEGAIPVANLFVLPQFLLGGTFFSTDVFPGWLRFMAELMPLYHFNTAMRLVAGEGAGLFEVAPYLLVLGAWGVVAYVLAARTFRWY